MVYWREGDPDGVVFTNVLPFQAWGFKGGTESDPEDPDHAWKDVNDCVYMGKGVVQGTAQLLLQLSSSYAAPLAAQDLFGTANDG